MANNESSGCLGYILLMLFFGIFLLTSPGFVVAMIIDFVHPLSIGPIWGFIILGTLSTYLFCRCYENSFKTYCIVVGVIVLLTVLYCCFFNNYPLIFINKAFGK